MSLSAKVWPQFATQVFWGWVDQWSVLLFGGEEGGRRWRHKVAAGRRTQATDQWCDQ